MWYVQTQLNLYKTGLKTWRTKAPGSDGFPVEFVERFAEAIFLKPWTKHPPVFYQKGQGPHCVSRIGLYQPWKLTEKFRQDVYEAETPTLTRRVEIFFYTPSQTINAEIVISLKRLLIGWNGDIFDGYDEIWISRKTLFPGSNYYMPPLLHPSILMTHIPSTSCYTGVRARSVHVYNWTAYYVSPLVPSI